MVGNVLADDLPKGGKWLAVKPVDASKPAAVVVKAMNNLLVGTGSLDAGVAAKQSIVDIRNNLNVDWDVFVQASRQDYRLANPAKPPLKPLDPGMVNGVDLSPKLQYVHPRQARGRFTQPAP
ncbi:hypothetical protein JZU46_05710 [bacterium]|nr:hypothetical protein [bacterium]